MATLTYSESRRACYFLCARGLRAVAGRVLDDMTDGDRAAFTFASLSWAKNVAANTARQANAVEAQGYEIDMHLDARTEAHQRKSRERYSAQIDRFESAIALRAGGDMLDAIRAVGTTDPAPIAVHKIGQ